MRYFPAFMDLSARTVVVSGGGELAVRKVRLLLPSGARIVGYNAPAESLLAKAFPDQISCNAAPLAEADLTDDVALVVAATGDAAEDARVANLARAHRITVNAVDQPDLCDVVIPSMVTRGDLVVGISTGGQAPVLGRRLRERLEAMLPTGLGDVIAFASARRHRVADRVSGPKRRAFWERFFSSAASEAVMAGDTLRADQLFNEELEGRTPGHVHIVGAGPGDTELLTLKALRVCQEADVILHDQLVTDEILNLCRRDAERIDVGKRRGHHTVPQADIGTLMIKLANEGKRVVRLKGGDPFIFGRGGEELEALQAAGVSASVVPGISAALGCASSAHVPLTHRGVSQAVSFVTAEAGGGGAPDINWKALAQLGGTIVVYMGVRRAADVSDALIEGGLSASTPIAVIAEGTRPNEQVVRASLSQLGEAAARISGPGLLIIGDVAAKATGEELIALAEERIAA
ncbi:MAG: siroheme synthase CysG [Pseudomonadota bacterium]